MFSFARQKRTRKAPATFDAREARPGFHPGPKSGGRRNKIGRCACGTDAFSDFAPAPILKGAYRKRQQGGEKPSPSRLRRATSPERERLWQRRKVCSLTVGFFLPLTGEDETYPLCQGLSLRKTSPGRGKMSPIGDKKGNSWTERVHLPKHKKRPQFSLRAFGFSTRFRSNGGKLSRSYPAYQAKPTAPFS